MKAQLFHGQERSQEDRGLLFAGTGQVVSPCVNNDASFPDEPIVE